MMSPQAEAQRKVYAANEESFYLISEFKSDNLVKDIRVGKVLSEQEFKELRALLRDWAEMHDGDGHSIEIRKGDSFIVINKFSSTYNYNITKQLFSSTNKRTIFYDILKMQQNEDYISFLCKALNHRSIQQENILYKTPKNSLIDLVIQEIPEIKFDNNAQKILKITGYYINTERGIEICVDFHQKKDRYLLFVFYINQGIKENFCLIFFV